MTQGVALAHGGEVLAVGGAAGVSDECRHYGGSVRIGSRIRNCFRTMHIRRSRLRLGGLGRAPDDPLTDSAAADEMDG